jgi:hypothetical protein
LLCTRSGTLQIPHHRCISMLYFSRCLSVQVRRAKSVNPQSEWPVGVTSASHICFAFFLSTGAEIAPKSYSLNHWRALHENTCNALKKQMPDARSPLSVWYFLQLVCVRNMIAAVKTSRISSAGNQSLSKLDSQKRLVSHNRARLINLFGFASFLEPSVCAVSAV